MTATNGDVERRLWAAADELRANSRLKASEYSMPVLGLIFLRYADVKFTRAEQELTAQTNSRRRIEILEEMARNIYREWFIHFHFPRHENIQFVDSPWARARSGGRYCHSPSC